MRIDGAWLLGDDDTLRPVIRGEVQCADGSWQPTPFLVDTGADCTVFSAAILARLGFSDAGATDRLGGVGGLAPSVVVETPIRLFQQGGEDVLFRGRFAAFTELAALDMSVLGRDILSLFAVIVDSPRDVVCLLAQNHEYLILPR
jgi:hypothetical protein